MHPQPFQQITRRTMLQRSAAGFGYLALQALLLGGRKAIASRQNL